MNDMVTKRELAEAQQDLNSAVGYWRMTNRDSLAFIDASNALRGTFDRWDRLRKQLDGQGPAVARSTSIAAAKANIMGKQSLRRTILSMVVNNFRQFDMGMTTDEIQGRLKGKHQSVSPRVSELVKTYQLLYDSGIKRSTSSDSQATVWFPTQEAIDLVLAAEQGAE